MRELLLRQTSKSNKQHLPKKLLAFLIFCAAFVSFVSTQEVIKANDTSLEAMQFDGNCIGCIMRGYRYCEDYQACLVFNATCPRGISYTQEYTCPVNGPCDGFGYKGLGYLGDDTVLATGGYI
jgi:hypothetical protein